MSLRGNVRQSIRIRPSVCAAVCPPIRLTRSSYVAHVLTYMVLFLRHLQRNRNFHDSADRLLPFPALKTTNKLDKTKTRVFLGYKYRLINVGR